MVSSVVFIIFIIPVSHTPDLTLIFPFPGSFPGTDIDGLVALTEHPELTHKSQSFCWGLLAAYCHKTLYLSYSDILLQVFMEHETISALNYCLRSIMYVPPPPQKIAVAATTVNP